MLLSGLVALYAQASGYTPGNALNPGMGQTHNTIHRPIQGWDVTGIDPADDGVRIAKTEAAILGLKVRAEVTTL